MRIKPATTNVSPKSARQTNKAGRKRPVPDSASNGVALLSKPAPEKLIPLSEVEQADLRRCEEVLKRGLITFLEVGGVLLTIRERQLYRESHQTFEGYCHDRWNISRSYAWRVIGAAERVELIAGDDKLPKPANEFQMRPFLKLAPEEFPEIWKQVVAQAKEGKVTTSTVRAVLRTKLPRNKGRTRKMTKVSVGQWLALLHEAKRHVEKEELELVLSVLERIENLLVRQ